MKRLTLMVSVVLGVAICSICIGKDRDPTQPKDVITQTLQELLKENYKASSSLRASYNEVRRVVKTELSRTPKNEIHYNDRLHLLSMVAGSWRLSSSTSELSKRISLKLDTREIPEGDSYSPAYLYPVASALSQIGDMAVVQSMIHVIRTGNVRERELAIWVIWDAFGVDYSKAILAVAAKRERDEKSRKLLKDAIKIVDDGGRLILEKNKKAQIKELYEGFKLDRERLRDTVKVSATDSTFRGSSDKARASAQRIFTKVNFVGKSKAKVLEILGDPRSISSYGVAAKPEKDSPLVYCFDNGYGGSQYTLHFVDGKVTRVEKYLLD